MTQMLAQQLNYIPGEFVHTFGNVHIYSNHMEQVKEQLSRTPSDDKPWILLNPEIGDILDYKWEDIQLFNYKPQAAIKAPVAI